MRNLEVPLVKNHATTATFKSRWLDARNLRSLHLHIQIPSTSAPAGAMTIEASNDPLVDRNAQAGVNADSTTDTVSAVDISAANYVVVSGSGLTVAGANTTMIMIDPAAAWIRVVYTRSGGGAATGMNVWAMGKS